MILRGWHVDGFGNWCDFRVDDLAPGLNLICGPNEVGKSTLHAFVRGVLYGFPDKRSREPAYPPLHGGDHGGRLFLDTASGPLVVARRVRDRTPRVEGAEGERLDAGLLRLVLGNTDAALFRSVFAFGLDELADLDALSSDEVGLRIFDAGLEGAGASVTALLDELRKRKEAELKARSGRIRALADEVLAARRERDAAVGRAEGYGERLRAEAEAEAKLAALGSDVDAARTALRRAEVLLATWPVEVRRRQALAQLAAAGLSTDVERQRPRLEALRAGAALQADRLRRIDALGRACAEREAALRESVASLGAGWSADRALGVDRSPARRGEIARHGEAIERAERCVQAGRDAIERADADLARVRAEIEALEAVREAPDEATLLRRRQALATWRAASAARDAATARVAELRDRSAAGAGARLALGATGLFALIAAGAAFASAWAVAGVAVLAALCALGISAAVRANPSLRKRLAQAEAELAERSAEVGAAAAVLGLAGEGSAAGVERAALELERDERMLRDSAERQRQRALLAGREAGCVAARQASIDAYGAALGARERATQAWQAHAADLGVSTVAAAGELLQHVEAVVRHVEQLRADAGELRDLHGAARAWDEQVAALLGSCGIAEPGIAGLDALAAHVASARVVLDAERHLAEQLGGGAAGEGLRAALADGERAAWELEREAAAGRVRALEADQAAAREALAVLRHEREQLESSADVPARAARVAELECELAAAVRRFRQAALLEGLVVEGLERFQQERQPVVLRHAGDAFRQITGGRWLGVRQPAGATEVEVIDSAGRGVAAGVLSRGAREQLYICIRLGLVRALAERGIQLPLLLDDVLVNFDPERADRTAAVLAAFAAEHQVLLFTCHPQTVARFAELVPGCRLIELAPARGEAALAGVA